MGIGSWWWNRDARVEEGRRERAKGRRRMKKGIAGPNAKEQRRKTYQNKSPQKQTILICTNTNEGPSFVRNFVSFAGSCPCLRGGHSIQLVCTFFMSGIN